MFSALFTKQELALATKGKWHGDFFDRLSLVTDSRKSCAGAIFVALCGDKFDAHSMLAAAVAAGAEALLINKNFVGSIPENIPVLRVDDTTLAYQNIAAYHRLRLKDLVLITITGSCGKTSVKEMLKSVLGEKFAAEQVYATLENTNNHIGVPQNILKISEKVKVAVLELGTSGPGEIAALSRICNADCALITKIGHSHLEKLHSVEGVAQEKADIFKSSKELFAVIPDSGYGSDILQKAVLSLNCCTFGETSGDYQYKHIGVNDDEFNQIEISDHGADKKYSFVINLPGVHQAANCAAVWAVGEFLKIPPQTIIKGLQKTVIPGMRMKTEKLNNNITLINDAYNANPESMISALRWLWQRKKNNLYLVLGDMLELGEQSFALHQKIVTEVFELFQGAVIVFIGDNFKQCDEGENGENIHFLKEIGEADKIFSSGKLKDAVVFLKGSRGMRLEKIRGML